MAYNDYKRWKWIENTSLEKNKWKPRFSAGDHVRNSNPKLICKKRH